MPRILPAEYDERLRRCSEAIQRTALDCLLVLPGSNFTYLLGQRFARERHRLLVALLRPGATPALMGASFEEAKLGSGPVAAEVHAWTDADNQYRLVAAWVERNCGSRARVGLEPTIGYYHYLRLREELPQARFVEAAACTDRLRATKSEAEIACLREAAARTRARLERVPSQLETGMSELELAQLFGPGAMIQFGLTTSMPNEVAGTRKLCDGDTIVIDAGDRVAGYRSDLTRTFFHGEPAARQREVYAVVNEAELAAIAAAVPGAPAEVVDLAARAVIEKAGYGDFFTHRGGHGLGLDFHEAPICVEGNREPLEPGMVLTAEPGIYLPGEFGIRLEDDILVTRTGAELLVERGPLYLD